MHQTKSHPMPLFIPSAIHISSTNQFRLLSQRVQIILNGSSKYQCCPVLNGISTILAVALLGLYI